MIKVITIKIDDNRTEQETLECLKPAIIIYFRKAKVEIVGKNETLNYQYKEVRR